MTLLGTGGHHREGSPQKRPEGSGRGGHHDRLLLRTRAQCDVHPVRPRVPAGPDLDVAGAGEPPQPVQEEIAADHPVHGRVRAHVERQGHRVGIGSVVGQVKHHRPVHAFGDDQADKHPAHHRCTAVEFSHLHHRSVDLWEFEGGPEFTRCDVCCDTRVIEGHHDSARPSWARTISQMTRTSPHSHVTDVCPRRPVHGGTKPSGYRAGRTAQTYGVVMSLGSRVERLPKTAAADAGQHPVVVGRARQLREITALLGHGSAAGRALLLHGEPGVGKSALLGEVARVMSGAGARVLSAVGVRFESELAYAGLHQLLLPLNDRIERLEDTHRRVLRSALGYGGDTVPDGRHVSDSVLFLLRQAATERPVFVVVDDLGCFDRASSAVLGFVARRSAGSRIGFLAACRSGAETFFDRTGLTEYELPPLDRDAAVELLGVRFPGLAGPARDRVLAQAQGNPLALVELPAALSGPQRDPLADLHDVLPLSPRLRSHQASRVARLPADSRRLLLLLALDDTGDPGVLRAGLRAGSDDPKALTALSAVESDRLIAFDDTNRRFVFRHPLLRAAVVETSTLTERCHAHRTLAEIRAAAPERRAWHLGRATLVPDEHVAALLEEAGHRAARRGDATAAVATFTRAAELSPRPADRGRRLTRAAYLAADATGELRVASELLD